MFGKIHVEAGAGDYRPDFIKELQSLSQKYSCIVTGNFNGNEIIVLPSNAYYNRKEE